VKVYVAGPLFTPYERRFIDECAAQLRGAGFDFFVPHEHELALDGTVTAERIFAKDRAALSEANAVLALLDGPTIDDGAACEIGIFYALMRSDPEKKGIVGLVTDLRATRETERQGEARGLNLFVVGCIEAAGQITTSLDEAQRVLEGWRIVATERADCPRSAFAARLRDGLGAAVRGRPHPNYHERPVRDQHQACGYPPTRCGDPAAAIGGRGWRRRGRRSIPPGSAS
jgi:nucleoside 2-deoxyribosyltransferase